MLNKVILKKKQNCVVYFKIEDTWCKECVKMYNWTSDEFPITYGVTFYNLRARLPAQGSVLGPTLFSVYIDTLCRLPLSCSRVFT